MSRRFVYGSLLIGSIACQSGSYFLCNEDDDCSAAGRSGVCQSSGACSFPDQSCASGQRYAAGGPPALAGECVDVDGGSTDSPEGSTGPLGGGSSTDPLGEASTSTSGVPLDDSTGSLDTTGDGCPPGWWDCAWAHRQPLSVIQPVDGMLTDVPALVRLSASRVDHALMQADGDDLRFVSTSGASLPFEIEHWDPEGESTIWVRMDELGGSADHLWLYYGNPVAEGANAPAGVWTEPYAGVWHLESAPVDSTPNANDAATNGSTQFVGGQIGNGLDLGSDDARIDVGARPSLAEVFLGGGTVSAWIRPRSWGGNGHGRIADKEEEDLAGWQLNVAGGGRLRFSAVLEAEETITWVTPPGALELHHWAHVAVTYDLLGAAPPRVFIDGVEQELDDPDDPPYVTGAPSDEHVALSLGNRPSNDRRFDGILDEVRVATIIRSPEWIRVQYHSARDELFLYGPIESWATGG